MSKAKVIEIAPPGDCKTASSFEPGDRQRSYEAFLEHQLAKEKAEAARGRLEFLEAEESNAAQIWNHSLSILMAKYDLDLGRDGVDLKRNRIKRAPRSTVAPAPVSEQPQEEKEAVSGHAPETNVAANGLSGVGPSILDPSASPLSATQLNGSSP